MKRRKNIRYYGFADGSVAPLTYIWAWNRSQVHFLIENIFSKTSIFRLIRIWEKIQIQLIDYFVIGNKTRVNTDSYESIFPLSTASFRRRNAWEPGIFRHVSHSAKKKHSFLRRCPWENYFLSLQLNRFEPDEVRPGSKKIICFFLSP